MDCLKSFTIYTSSSENASAPKIDTWGALYGGYWIYNNGGISTFNIEGFKNINVHGVACQGDVGSTINTGNSVIVEDWSFIIQINGQNPLVSGTVVAAPNNFNITPQAQNPIFAVGKYNSKFMLSSPIQSAKTITINNLIANGYGNENAAVLNIAWNVNFIVYYTYEGETY
jgi:hypothetical protein